MSKRERENRRKLELRRERLRQLAALGDQEAGQVAGGVLGGVMNYPDGRVGSRCCA